jgi:NAD(P)-dependent dehydrogenase (short-subunit alcohol dehydrogenase family)
MDLRLLQVSNTNICSGRKLKVESKLGRENAGCGCAWGTVLFTPTRRQHRNEAPGTTLRVPQSRLKSWPGISKHAPLPVACLCEPTSAPRKDQRCLLRTILEHFRSRCVGKPLQIDIMVNNAGVVSDALIEYTGPQEVEWMYRTNVLGPLLLMPVALPFCLMTGLQGY